MELEKRILNLIRKSDDKSFYAEVRAYPNRYARLENETIKVSYLDSEDNMTRKDVDLNYVIAKAEEWLWENDDFKANFIIPEPQQSSATQTPFSGPPHPRDFAEIGRRKDISSLPRSKDYPFPGSYQIFCASHLKLRTARLNNADVRPTLSAAPAAARQLHSPQYTNNLFQPRVATPSRPKG